MLLLHHQELRFLSHQIMFHSLQPEVFELDSFEVVWEVRVGQEVPVEEKVLVVGEVHAVVVYYISTV